MIQIINKAGLTAHLKPDTSIPIERNNPLFLENDELFEDITYSFTLPADESNKEFLSSGHLVEAANSVYEIEVETLVSGHPFFAGTLRYSYNNPDFKALLIINYGVISDIIKKVTLKQLYFADGFDGFSQAAEEAFMKDTCEHPQKYPFAFFPVKNEDWFSVEGNPGQTFNPRVNPWNTAEQRFTINQQPLGEQTLQAQYFKISYLLTIIFKNLGFTCNGNYFLSDAGKNHYLFHPSGRSGAANTEYSPTNLFLPDMKVVDFLKQVRNREKLCYSVDFLNKMVTIESAETILNNIEDVDLTDYITKITEIAIPDKSGYTVSLKSDESDKLMNISTGSTPVFDPPYQMIINSGENTVELDVSTTREEYVDTYKYYIPVVKRKSSQIYPIRILWFAGMRTLEGGLKFPEARPLELNEKDAVWYKLLNDSKSCILHGSVPVEFLSKLRSFDKVRFISKEGFLSYAIIKQIKYSLTNRSDIVKVEIPVVTMVNSYESRAVFLKTADPNISLQQGAIKYKAFFDPKIHGFTELEAIRVDDPNTFTSTKIYNPSTKFGMGGDIGYMNQTNGNDALQSNSEIRIYGKFPKYAIVGGQQVNFLVGSGYSYIQPGNLIFKDLNPVLIVF